MSEITSLVIIALSVAALFYFVIKTVVKGGINRPVQFSEKLREAQRKREEQKKRASSRDFDKEA